MWELDYKESWALKNWCFWTVVLEKTLESPLDCKEIQLVHPKGDQSWVFIGRTDVEAETPILMATWCKERTHRKRPWCWEKLKAEGEGDDRGWDGWIASPPQWTWVWTWVWSLLPISNSGSCWWTGKPAMLQSMGSQRVRDDWATELNINNIVYYNWFFYTFCFPFFLPFSSFLALLFSLCLLNCNLSLNLPLNLSLWKCLSTFGIVWISSSSGTFCSSLNWLSFSLSLLYDFLLEMSLHYSFRGSLFSVFFSWVEFFSFWNLSSFSIGFPPLSWWNTFSHNFLIISWVREYVEIKIIWDFAYLKMSLL